MNNNFFDFLKVKGVYQRGVALLVTFVIMGIVVAMVLGVSVILLSELKTIRGIGDSVVAFYSADTGIEKTLYYDRKVIPENGTRGICNICSSCSPDDCQSCTTTGNDCASETCADCQITYSSQFGSKSFKIKLTTSTLGDILQSYGTYSDASRAIELSGSTGGSVPSTNTGPTITNATATPRSVPEGIAVDIIATIVDSDGLNPSSLKATIRKAGNANVDIILQNISGDVYWGTWTGPVGVYYVDITACDTLGECTTVQNI